MTETNENPFYELLKKEVLATRGFDLNQYSQEYVKRRINARILALGISRDNWEEYVKVLKNDPREYLSLFDTFSVNVTEFFRDPSVWKVLKDEVFPAIIEEKRALKPSVLRFWSAGCSTGEEPYSIAILLKELMPPEIQLAFIATDIDTDAIRRARDGIYRKEALKGVAAMNPAWVTKYFAPFPSSPEMSSTEPAQYQVVPELKRMVMFKEHNFLNDAPFVHIDVIFCRNAMIYLTQPVKEQLFEVFYRSLIANGMLVIGKSEIIFLGKGKFYFYPVNTLEHIYRRERRKPEPKSVTFMGQERRKNWWWGRMDNRKGKEEA